MKNILFLLILIFSYTSLFAQEKVKTAIPSDNTYWNTDLKIVPFRLSPYPAGYKPTYIDLDKDGDPDVMKTIAKNGVPVTWIDDDDDMKYGDVEGDTDSDCVIIDRNKNGQNGGPGNLILDWVDEDGDNIADLQIVAEYAPVEKKDVWSNGHYFLFLDTDHDGIFNYVDWNTFLIEAWDHNRSSDFFPDYSGKSIFMKVHAATNRIEDVRMNWENPFLFYDPDKDGLTEMAVRLVDSTTYFNDPNKKDFQQTTRFSGKINWVSISVDLDNDNSPADDFDFDFSLGFFGGGFNYMDQVHKIKMHSLPGTDSFFMDPRWRHLDELIYTDHDHALPLIFTRGKWNQVYFVYDEDDDCHRWERTEFLWPYSPFKIGSWKGGIDNNQQSDPSGDRGEWDLNNSGKGKLYVSRFDGKIHLYGAEWGCWRIDQTASYYQGWDRRILKSEPTTFATIKYEDSDNNGFMDKISYDLDGDTLFEQIVNLKELDLDDRCDLINIEKFSYKDYVKLQKKVAAKLWENAETSKKVAEKYGLNLNWYAKFFRSESTQQKYNNGFWLQFYIYKDLENLFIKSGNSNLLKELNKAYFGSDWESLL